MLRSSRRGSGYRIRRLHQVFRYRTGGLAPPARAAVPSGHFRVRSADIHYLREVALATTSEL